MSADGTPPATLPAPGWYPDPWAPQSGYPGAARWWDGQQWTPHASTARPVQAAPAVQATHSPQGVPLAGPGSRFLARVIDGLLLAVLTLVPVLLIGGLLLIAFIHRVQQINDRSLSDAEQNRQLDDLTRQWLPGLIALYVLLFVYAIALQVLYEAILTARTGQTVGKRLANIRVVRLDTGQLMSLKASYGRVAMVLVLNGTYVDQLWCLWDKPWRQCIHDKPVSTIVVKA